MKVEIPVVNAFIDGSFGGNSAGIVLNADKYTSDEKQRIAKAVGLSETAFVSSSSIADFKLDFFTPTCQIAHCGHATIATFNYLKQIGLLKHERTSKETIDGRREIYMQGDFAFMEQLAPKYSKLNKDDFPIFLESIGLVHDDILENSQPYVINTGNSFLIVAVKDAQSVKAVKPNYKIISEVSEKYDLIGYYVFSLETTKENRDAGARMFAPRYGIEEESATGTAAGPLACYLYDKLQIKKNQFKFEQGHLMIPASKSIITVNLQTFDGFVSGLMAGGKAKVIETRVVEI